MVEKNRKPGSIEGAKTASNSVGKATGKLSSSTGLVTRSATARSKISNGTAILPNVDGRSRLARRYYDIAAALATDQGGIDRMSEARQQLCRRLAGASALAEQIEADMALGKPIDITTYATVVSTAVRVTQRLGLDRRLRTVVPTLSEYLEAKANERETAE